MTIFAVVNLGTCIWSARGGGPGGCLGPLLSEDVPMDTVLAVRKDLCQALDQILG
jgi:hypothetical protein